MIGKIHWKGNRHMCCDIIIIEGKDVEEKRYKGGVFSLMKRETKRNVPYLALIDIKRSATEQIVTDRIIKMYAVAYKKLHGRVLHLGLGLNLGEHAIQCESMMFIEHSKDVILNVKSKWPVIKGDATNRELINKLGKFDTIFVDITNIKRPIDYSLYLKDGGSIITLI